MNASGLSKLQRKILAAIADVGGCATTQDLLERVYGWEPRLYPGTPRRENGLLPLGLGTSPRFFGFPRAPRVALSRALARLERRRLVSWCDVAWTQKARLGSYVAATGGWVLLASVLTDDTGATLCPMQPLQGEAAE
jgi:hypothetical protein